MQVQSLFLYIFAKKSPMYKILAKLNKILLPSFTKQGLDISKAKKWQMALIGYRAYVTKRALG
ncbi:hypothetical protein BD847_1172 [Flavobacterium cutihirudinis]|uniref:SsrA-binding protein n=1 Tax=Flavobacterium cutihirudinis TaxID=1265740 RepID=A0A3D9G1Y8_9FLAO|nr:hypothetical protein BD847_1172 [Flavobacterium cutihirudinis]